MTYSEILSKHFKNVDIIIDAIYSNGGISSRGYGFICGGYGGGVEMKQANIIIWVDGYIAGVGTANKQEGHTLLKAINMALLEKYPTEITNDNVPFINLTEAMI